ncbi:MAG: class I SAM-dependent methyltransferase [Candidatus Sericytochromatia bacterium]
MLKLIVDKIKEIKEKKSNFKDLELDWTDYEFGKNFYLNVFRNKEQTDIETNFIIEKLRLKDEAKILDLGCGGGRNSQVLSNKGFDVLGIDLNKYAIEEAKKLEKEKLKFINQNILDIDFKEQFNASILIFNHFSSFNRIEARKLLKKIETSLVKDGKVLIEIQSLSFGESINKTQEWFIKNSWISGDYEQLVLVDNDFDSKSKIHTRLDYCLNLNNFELKTFTQTSYLYTLEDIYNIFSSTDLKIKQIYGNWEGKIFEEDDDTMIIIGQK